MQFIPTYDMLSSNMAPKPHRPITSSRALPEPSPRLRRPRPKCREKHMKIVHALQPTAGPVSGGIRLKICGEGFTSAGESKSTKELPATPRESAGDGANTIRVRFTVCFTNESNQQTASKRQDIFPSPTAGKHHNLNCDIDSIHGEIQKKGPATSNFVEVDGQILSPWLVECSVPSFVGLSELKDSGGFVFCQVASPGEPFSPKGKLFGVVQAATTRDELEQECGTAKSDPQTVGKYSYYWHHAPGAKYCQDIFSNPTACKYHNKASPEICIICAKADCPYPLCHGTVGNCNNCHGEIHKGESKCVHSGCSKFGKCMMHVKKLQLTIVQLRARLEIVGKKLSEKCLQLQQLVLFAQEDPTALLTEQLRIELEKSCEERKFAMKQEVIQRQRAEYAEECLRKMTVKFARMEKAHKAEIQRIHSVYKETLSEMEDKHRKEVRVVKCRLRECLQRCACHDHGGEKKETPREDVQRSINITSGSTCGSTSNARTVYFKQTIGMGDDSHLRWRSKGKGWWAYTETSPVKNWNANRVRGRTIDRTRTGRPSSAPPTLRFHRLEHAPYDMKPTPPESESAYSESEHGQGNVPHSKSPRNSAASGWGNKRLVHFCGLGMDKCPHLRWTRNERSDRISSGKRSKWVYSQFSSVKDWNPNRTHGRLIDGPSCEIGPPNNGPQGWWKYF